MKRTFLQRVQLAIIAFINRFSWRSWSPKKNQLTEADKTTLRQLCAKDYFIIATRRPSFLSAWCINLGHFLLTGRWGYYTHVLMNTEDEVSSDLDFRFIEAVSKGVTFSTFDDIIKYVDSVCLLKPKMLTLEEWTKCLDAAKTYEGIPYDNLFSLINTEEINCVELVRLALKALPNYDTMFANFERTIYKKKGKLTPQMFIECPDFEVYWEVRN